MRARIVLLVFSALLSPLLAASEAGAATDFFLHGTGPENNPPTLFLDTTAPTASTAKFRDSASVNFSGGNPWKEIGTWPAASALTSGDLTALSDLHVWLGLKNSDDQGTQFDLQAEVYKNGVLITSGLTRCITDIVRNAANAKEVTVAFGSFASVPFNGTTDTLSLKILTRIGTNPDNTKCPGHNNAVGLRLYFDSTTRQARFDATIGGGAPPPTITNFTPTSGRGGVSVTITGTNFVNVSAVTFNGVSATFTVGSSTSITATAPTGVTTGPIAVTTTGGTATSPAHFVAIPTHDFQLGTAPATITIPASGQAALAVSLSSTAGFADLTTLSVTGLPTGMTAAFQHATLTANQSTVLLLTTTGATPAGTTPLTVSTAGLLNGVLTTRSVTVNVQVLAAGVTTLSGQVLDEDDKPVKNALVKLGILQVSTDDGGNFLIQNPPAGADQFLSIDGGPASTPQHNLPIVPYKVTIVAGQNNTLGFTPKLHFQKTTGLVDISNSAVQRTVTDPDLPGFQMTIPAGVTITGWDGQPNQQISIRRVPIDRTPLPPELPGNRLSPVVYMDYFGKPGGGTPSEPIPITLPNDVEADPGTQVELWFYDEAPDGSRPNQWAQYGTGTVSADGTLIVPDIDPATGKPFGQPRFCCGALRAALAQLSTDPATGAHGAGEEGGEPVDLATGIFRLQQTDLVLSGRFPVAFTRFYRTKNSAVGPFGLGSSHAYDMRLLIVADQRTLLLPNGGRVLFAKQPDGTFRNGNAPAYRGAVLTQAGGSHTLRFKDGTTWTFGLTVSVFGYLTAQADRNGNQITLTRNSSGRLDTITDAAGRQFTLAYDGLSRITSITDVAGRVVRYAYQGNTLATVTDPLGQVTNYTYEAGRLKTIIDARGIVFLTNDYDSAGRVIQQAQADSGLWQFAYTTSGGLVTQTIVTDPQGHRTTSRFNGFGYPLGRADGVGQSAASARDANSNLLLSATDSLERKTTYEYDANGNVTKITDPDNKTTQFEYEPTFNRVKKITDALNQFTEFTYDPANGNLLTTKDPLNNVTTITYNSFGQPLTVTDPLGPGHTTTFAYDADGNLSTTTDPLGNSTQRAYDAISRLIALTDPRSLLTQFRYDELNRTTEIADARQGITRFGYDPNGNLLSVADAKNQPTTYTYANMDRLSDRKDALNRQETYTYDQVGNLTQFKDRKNQTSTFGYDNLNRRISASYQDGSTTSFVYDAQGRLSRTTDSLGGPIDFFYDNLDRLILELTPQGAVAYEYDAIGRRTKMTVAGQAPVTYGYDAASRLTQVAQGSLIVTIGYDAAGRRTSLTYSNGTNTSYAYDNASRLTNIAHNGPSGIIESLSYVYDAAGNRISITRTNGTASNLPAAVQAAYDAANEQVTFNSLPATFDANGNQTTSTDASGTTTYTWDARNRMVSQAGPGVNATFQYDALGQRVSKTINGVTTSYLYDGNDIVQEIGGSAVGASYVRSLNIDEPFVRQMASGNEFYHTDELGSTLALSSAAGAMAVSYSYEAFGKTTVTGISSNPFQYTGRENDGSGLYYYRARYYTPHSQRFISEDPLEFESGDTNRYAYVFNSPTNDTDPTGEIIPALLAFCGRSVFLSVSFDLFAGRKPTLGGAFSGCIPGIGALGKVKLGAVGHNLTNNPFINNLLKNLPVISSSKKSTILKGSGGAQGQKNLMQQLTGGNAGTTKPGTLGPVQVAPIPGGGTAVSRATSSPPNPQPTIDIHHAGPTIKIRF